MEEVPEAGRDRVGSSKGVATDPQRTIPLLDAMVDVALVYGFDETCSRELGVMMDEQVRGKYGVGGRRNYVGSRSLLGGLFK